MPSSYISQILQMFRHKPQGMDQMLDPSQAQMSGTEYLDQIPSGGRPHYSSNKSPGVFQRQNQEVTQNRMDDLSGGLPITPFLINKYRSDLSNPGWIMAHPLEALEAKKKLEEYTNLYLNNKS